jgi:hypothetical protein
VPFVTNNSKEKLLAKTIVLRSKSSVKSDMKVCLSGSFRFERLHDPSRPLFLLLFKQRDLSENKRGH